MKHENKNVNPCRLTISKYYNLTFTESLTILTENFVIPLQVSCSLLLSTNKTTPSPSNSSYLIFNMKHFLLIFIKKLFTLVSLESSDSTRINSKAGARHQGQIDRR